MKKMILKAISLVAAITVVLSVTVMACSASGSYEAEGEIPVPIWEEERDLACRDD